MHYLGDQIHDFAPCKMWTAEDIVLAISKAKAFHQFLVGGDQMTAAQCCGSGAVHCVTMILGEAICIVAIIVSISKDCHNQYIISVKWVLEFKPNAY